MRFLDKLLSLCFALCLCALSFCAAYAGASEASYVSFQVPGAMGTYPMSVNNSMAVTGYYYASATLVRGFVRQANGTFATFDAVGSTWTEPEGINDAGEVTGYYLLNPGQFEGLEPEGFIRYPDGRIVTFNPPCYTTCDTSMPFSINAFCEVAGSYPYYNGTPGGFTRTRDKSFTTYLLQFGNFTGGAIATSINDSGTAAGFYQPTSGPNLESFIVDARGYLTDGIYVPAPNTNAPYTGLESTVAEAINDEGTIVGWYTGCNKPCAANPSVPNGFVLSSDGKFTLFTPPGNLVIYPEPGAGGVLGYTEFFEDLLLISAPHRLSINEPGSVTGSYTDAASAQHGFVRNPYGTMTSFDPPKGHQTTATSINDSGVITGTYLYNGSNPTSVGFLRIPQPK